jgi:hypothetical protein
MTKYRVKVHFDLGNDKIVTFTSQPFETAAEADAVAETLAGLCNNRMCGYHMEAYVQGPGWVVWDEGDQDPADMARNYAQKNGPEAIFGYDDE